MNNQRFIVLSFLAAAVVTGLTVSSAAESILASMGIADADVFGLVPRSSMSGLVSGVVCFLVLVRNQAAVTFTGESIVELAKVTWPDREETVRSSSIVIGVTFFIAGCLAVYDFVWKRVADLFLFTQS